MSYSEIILFKKDVLVLSPDKSKMLALLFKIPSGNQIPE